MYMLGSKVKERFYLVTSQTQFLSETISIESKQKKVEQRKTKAEKGVR